MRKFYLLKTFFVCFAFVCSQADAAIECISKVSNSVTTPDWHCSKHCGDWANTRPMQTLTLEMDQKFKNMGAFFRNPSSSCVGGALCGFSNIPTPGVSANAEQVKLSFKTWSRPVVVTVSADICVVNNAAPPPTPSSNPVVLPSNPIPPKAPVVAPAGKPPVPPQKAHDVEEAGPLADNCDRMKSNWFVDAKNYCSPHNVNLSATNLVCSQRPDGLFRKVSGVFICTP